MKNYIVVFPAKEFSSGVRQKIMSFEHFELYPNVFFIKCEFLAAKSVYEHLQLSEDSNEKMIVLEVSSTYWGFADKDLWTWLVKK